MTTPTDGPAPSAPAGGSRRLALIVAAVLLVGAGAWFGMRLVQPQWRTWAHGAGSEEYRKKLVAEQDPAVLDVIEDVMRDADQSDHTRLALADVLLAKNRLGLVEKALKDPRLDVRVVALRALSRLQYFRKQYVEDAAWGVGPTVAAWLSDPRSKSRASAAALSNVVWPGGEQAPDDVRRALRAMVAAQGGAAQANARAAAAGVLAGWNDCEAAPDLLVRAKTDDEPYARLRILQAVVQLYDARGCGDRLPEAEVRAAFESCVAWPGDGDLNRSVRMAAVMTVHRHPEWAGPVLATMRARAADVDLHEAERRATLDALVAAKDADVVTGFSRWFHDPSPGMRASAVASVQLEASPVATAAYESCLVGYLRDEPIPTTHEFSLRAAYGMLRRKAGAWVGLPGALRDGKADIAAMDAPLKALFGKGEVEGVTRAQVAAALWRWLAERRGVPAAEVADAEKARDAFWAKARAGDVAGARAALEPLRAKWPELWTYEDGWLIAHPK